MPKVGLLTLAYQQDGLGSPLGGTPLGGVCDFLLFVSDPQQESHKIQRGSHKHWRNEWVRKTSWVPVVGRQLPQQEESWDPVWVCDESLDADVANKTGKNKTGPLSRSIPVLSLIILNKGSGFFFKFYWSIIDMQGGDHFWIRIFFFWIGLSAKGW